MVSSDNKTTYEKQWNLLHDLSILSKPHVLKEEGYPVVKTRNANLTSQRGIYIFSLEELDIGRPYITKGETCIVRVSKFEIQMGELFSSEKDKNGVVTLRIPTAEDLAGTFYQPTLSGILMGEIMLLALEQFTKKELKKGFFFYELAEGDLQFGRSIRSLDELSPNITYVSEDYSVKLKRRTGGRFSFFFAGYNVPGPEPSKAPSASESIHNIAAMIASALPNQESLAGVSVESVVTDFLENEEQQEDELLQNGDDDEITNLIKSLGLEDLAEPGTIDTSIPPPPPAGPPPPPPLPLPKRIPAPGDINKKKMRPLRWSTIPRHQLNQTIWGHDSTGSPTTGSSINVVEQDLVRLFSISPVNSPSKKQLGNRTIKKNKCLLSVKRANNIAIVLSRLPAVEELRKAVVLECDLTLSMDQLNSLYSLLPIDEDEIDRVRSSKRSREELSKAEQFVLTMSTVPRLSSKVNCLRFIRILKEDYADIMPKIKIITLACKEAKTSRRLRHILKLILEIGSILNRDTYLSGLGFRLQSLKSISETKAKRGGVTLVHYLSQLILKNDPKLLDFESEEIPHCEEASMIHMEAIVEEVEEIAQQMIIVEQELAACQNEKENSSSLGDSNFAEELSRFHKEANQKVDALKKASAALRVYFTEVRTYFGEDPSDTSTNSSEFFSIIHQFSEHLLETKGDNRATKMMQKMVDTPSPSPSIGDVSVSVVE